MKMVELQTMSDSQLVDTMRDIQVRLFRLRVESAVEKLKSPRMVRSLRKDIARIKTLQRQRELAAAQEAANGSTAPVNGEGS